MQKKTLFMWDNPPETRSSRSSRKKNRVRLRRSIFKALFKSLELILIILRIAHSVYEFLKK